MKDDFEWETNLYDLLDQLSYQNFANSYASLLAIFYSVCVHVYTCLPLEAPQL